MGESENKMPGNGVDTIVRGNMVVWLSAPLTPVTETLKVPDVVAPLETSVSVDEPAPVIVVGAKAPVTPAGRPRTLRPTTPLNEFTAPVEIVEKAVPPALSINESGAALIVKSGANWLVTASVTVVDADNDPLVPVMRMG